jgi:hypothetical protein
MTPANLEDAEQIASGVDEVAKLLPGTRDRLLPAAALLRQIPELNRGLQVLTNRLLSCEAALTKAEQQLSEREWRPIETAPRDGRNIIGYYPCIESNWVVFFDPEMQQWQQGSGMTAGEPSHWMPLPGAPK